MDVYMCMYKCMFELLRRHQCMSSCTFMHAYTHVWCMLVCMNLCMCIFVCGRIKWECVHGCMHVFMHACMHVNVCIELWNILYIHAPICNWIRESWNSCVRVYVLVLYDEPKCANFSFRIGQICREWYPRSWKTKKKKISISTVCCRYGLEKNSCAMRACFPCMEVMKQAPCKRSTLHRSKNKGAGSFHRKYHTEYQKFGLSSPLMVSNQTLLCIGVQI